MYKILVLFILVSAGYVYSECSEGVCEIPIEGELNLVWNIEAHFESIGSRNINPWSPGEQFKFNNEMYYITKDVDNDLYYVGLASGIGVFKKGSETNAKAFWFKINEDGLSTNRKVAPIFKKIIIRSNDIYASTMFGSVVIKFNRLTDINDFSDQMTISVLHENDESDSEKRVIVDMLYSFSKLFLLRSEIDLQQDGFSFNYYNMIKGAITVINTNEGDVLHSYNPSSSGWGGYSLTADDNRVIACGVSGVIIWNENTQAFSEKSGMGFTFTSAIYIPSTQNYYLFANGFILEYNSAFSLIWLNILKDNPIVYSSYLYSSNGIDTVILTTSESRVYRFDLSTKLQWRSNVLDAHGATSMLITDDSSQIYATTSNTANKVHILSSSDCVSLGCSCNGDPFCNFCEETLQCSFSTECSSIHNDYKCATVEHKSDLKGDISGGTEIKIGLSYIDVLNKDNYVCRMGNDDLNPPTVLLASNEIICFTNVVESTGKVPLYIEIELENDRVKIAEFEFEFYDCSELGCSNCRSDKYPECRWSSTALCSKGTSESEACSSINGVTPDIAPFDQPTDIVISTSFKFKAEEDRIIKCKFGDVEVDGFPNENGNVECTTPDFSDNPSIKQIDLTITVDSKDVTSPFLFEFYSCDSYTNCNDCLEYREYCKWKLGECHQLNDDHVQDLQCPIITHINPSAINADTNEFYIIGENIDELDSQSFYECLIDFKDGNIDRIPATIEPALKRIKCVGPITHKVRSTVVSVSIVAVGFDGLFSNPFDVSLFACSLSDTCDSCLTSSDPGIPNCNWCKSSGKYQCTFNIEGDCLTQCPSILKVEPSKFVINRPIVITITLSDTFKRNLRNIDEDDEVSAELYLNNDNYEGTCNYDSVTEKVECSFPAISISGTYILTLKVGDSIYTESYEYEIFSCESINTCYGCIDELDADFCSWDGGHSCVPKLANPVITECPNIEISEDKQFSVNGGEEIIMTLDPDYKDELGFGSESFDCNFVMGENSYRSPETEYDSQTNTIKCTTPGVAKPGRYELYLMYRYSPGNEAIYAIHENIIFYDCHTGNTGHCSDSCLKNNPPYCVYCTQLSRCTAAHECLSNSPYKITEGTCPSTVVNPPYITYSDSKTIEVTFDRHINDLGYKFECHFTMITSDTSFNGAKTFRADGLAETEDMITTIKCIAPSITLPSGRYDAVAMLDIRVDLTQFTNSTLLVSLLKEPHAFTWVDCSMDEDEANIGPSWCESCNSLRHEYCGFCLTDFKCSIKEECSDPSYFPRSSISCPSLLEVVPSVGDPKGGTEVVLRGEGFIDDPNIIIFVGSNEAEILSINDTEIVFITPKAESDGDAEVQVYFGSNLYSSDVLIFSYQYSKLSPGAIVAIVLIILAIIATAIIILIYMKKKRIGYFKKRLEEPNYAQIAFGKHNDSLLYSIPKDNFKLLENVLLEYDKKFLFAISRIIPLTDHDKVAKSLIELYHSHSMAKDAIIAMIAEEVKVEKSENTIFRGNSMTSKMFKYYSKLIGVRFLWSKSARLLNELNNIGKQRMKDQKKKSTDSSGGSSLLTMEMEIDPVRTANGEFTEEDTQANVYQLIVTCQKIFSTLLRSLKEMPVEFREIFCECDKFIRERFGSADSVYKAIGGFIFLRFICPAFTAPQAYGLLESQPNTVTQRQLVLIGKVLQNLANMTIPGHKESFMVELTSFFEKNIPKMREFYLSILTMPSREEIEEQKMNFPLPIESHDVSSTVKLNALGEIWSVISEIKRFPEKLEEVCEDPEDAKRFTELYLKMKKKYSKKKRDVDEDPEAEKLVKKKRKDSG